MAKHAILLIGPGDHCRSCIDVIEQEGSFEIAGIVGKSGEAGIGMRDAASGQTDVLGYPLIGTDEYLPELRKKYKYAIVTVGQITSPETRRRIFDRLLELDFELPAIISPLAYVSRHAKVGRGTIVMHHALVNAGAKIGDNCIINTKALVEHDAVVQDHGHIATGTIVNGQTRIKQGYFIGSNALFANNVTVGRECIVLEGAQSAQRLGRQDKIPSIRIGFLGDGTWAYNALRSLHNDERIEIAFVALRGKRPDQVLQRLAKDLGLYCTSPKKINRPDFLDWAQNHSCDLFVSMSFDQIFKKHAIDTPRLGTINCHAGKLPFYRGRNVLNWALINDEPEFGITVHYVDEGIDTGDIILQRAYPITDGDNYATLLETAYKECPRLLHQALELILHGRVQQVRQSMIHPVGMYCPARGPGDEVLDWKQTSRVIFNFVRAICEPGPMARTRLGDEDVCINEVQLVPGAPIYKGIPGAVLFVQDQVPFVKTGDSMIGISDYRKQGRQLRAGDRLS